MDSGETLSEELRRVYGELPLWISDKVISKCGIDKRESITSKFIKYVLEPYVNKRREELDRGEKVTLDVAPLIEASMRGWKELPIRPLSRGEMDRGILGAVGSRILGGIHVKISYSPKDEAKIIVMERLERPPPPPPPPPQVTTIDVWELGNILLGLGLLKRDQLGANVGEIELHIDTESGCALTITRASLEDLKWIIGEDPINTFINRVSPVASEVRFAKLHIKLSNPMDKEKVEKMIRGLGVSDGNFSTGK